MVVGGENQRKIGRERQKNSFLPATSTTTAQKMLSTAVMFHVFNAINAYYLLLLLLRTY